MPTKHFYTKIDPQKIDREVTNLEEKGKFKEARELLIRLVSTDKDKLDKSIGTLKRAVDIDKKELKKQAKDGSGIPFYEARLNLSSDLESIGLLYAYEGNYVAAHSYIIKSLQAIRPDMEDIVRNMSAKELYYSLEFKQTWSDTLGSQPSFLFEAKARSQLLKWASGLDEPPLFSV
ncbi:MAG: hypothetical protein ABR981_01370 [Candidatus Micrarchaeaceae archaeon]|jgi:tetratricopeptide (TPR) repeat protein